MGTSCCAFNHHPALRVCYVSRTARHTTHMHRNTFGETSEGPRWSTSFRWRRAFLGRSRGRKRRTFRAEYTPQDHRSARSRARDAEPPSPDVHRTDDRRRSRAGLACLIFPVQFFSTEKRFPDGDRSQETHYHRFPGASHRDVLAGPRRVCAIRRSLWSSEHAKCRLPPPPGGHVVTRSFGSPPLRLLTFPRSVLLAFILALFVS